MQWRDNSQQLSIIPKSNNLGVAGVAWLSKINVPVTCDIPAHLCSFGSYNFVVKEKMYGRTGIIKAPLPSVIVSSPSA